MQRPSGVQLSPAARQPQASAPLGGPPGRPATCARPDAKAPTSKRRKCPVGSAAAKCSAWLAPAVLRAVNTRQSRPSRLQIAWSYFLHEQPGAQRLTSRHVFPGRVDKPARRLGRSQCGIGPHAGAACPVAFARSKRSASRCIREMSALVPFGAKSATVNTACAAVNASASSAFPVLDQLAGRCRASSSAPKCCCARAASSVLPWPVGPAK